jgi:arginyl-tRNA--protein-N-Asp/Glu arginylyltransferase
MRIFHREFGSRYESYEFGYSVYASLEANDALSEVYGAGFLPHSADPNVRDLFYMARSVRVPLNAFKLTSENRRILKKFEDFTSVFLTKEELAADASFLPCFLSYFHARHGERVMTEERARGILATPHPLRGIRYEKNGAVAGYVLEIPENGFAHYWYSCYDPIYTGTSLGMWLMLDAVLRAQKEERDYIYLGTAYGSKGRYKTNFEPLEFWDGSEWGRDTKELKRLIGNGT